MNIRHYRGDNRTLALTVTDANGVVDLGGASIWFTVKRSANDLDADAIISKASGSVPGGGNEQIDITSPATGEAEIYILPEDTAGLQVPTYDWVYDVQVKTSEDKVYTVKQGTFRLLPEITHSG